MYPFSWNDNLHFIQIQLSKYFPKGYPRRFISEIIGGSDTTIRKYEYEKWDLGNREKKMHLKKAFSEIDYSTYEIKLLTPNFDGYVFFADTCNHRIVKKEKPTVVDTTITLPKEPMVTLYPGIEKYDFHWPQKPGVYMLAQITHPCNNPEEIFYIIKIGKSTKLNQRIASYNGSNPFCSCIDIKETSVKEVDSLEEYYHKELTRVGGERQLGTEWFVVPKDVYKKLIEQGFNGFYFL